MAKRLIVDMLNDSDSVSRRWFLRYRFLKRNDVCTHDPVPVPGPEKFRSEGMPRRRRLVSL
jgi:hypothetical protein